MEVRAAQMMWQGRGVVAIATLDREMRGPIANRMNASDAA